MKIVIDISENDYWSACNHPEVFVGDYARTIKNGTPLPKGHGRLINSDDLFKYLLSGSTDWSFISVLHFSDFHSDIYDIFLSVFYSLNLLFFI